MTAPQNYVSARNCIRTLLKSCINKQACISCRYFAIKRRPARKKRLSGGREVKGGIGGGCPWSYSPVPPPLSNHYCKFVLDTFSERVCGHPQPPLGAAAHVKPPVYYFTKALTQRHAGDGNAAPAGGLPPNLNFPKRQI